MEQYHAVVLWLYQKQLDSGTNNFAKEQLVSNNTKFLVQQVKERKARIEEENCVEKINILPMLLNYRNKFPELKSGYSIAVKII